MRTTLKQLAALLLATALFTSSATAAAPVLKQDDVLNYLEQLINWQRNAATLDPATSNARELIFQDSLQQNALHVLQSGFTFARSEAAHQTADAADSDSDKKPTSDKKYDTDADSDADDSPRDHIVQRAADTDKQIADNTKQIADLKHKVATAKGASRPALQKQLSDAQDQAKLLAAKQSLLKTVLTNMSSAESGESKGFLGKIDNLARSIPELAGTTKDNSASPAASNATASGPSMAFGMPVPATPPTVSTKQATVSVSVLTLAGNAFDITRRERDINDVIAQTTQLQTANRKLIDMLRTALDQTSQTGDDSESIDDKVAAYKQTAADILPLGEANMWVGISKHTLKDWHDVLDMQLKSVLRQLAIHLAILAFTLAIPMAISSVLKRVIIRYITDPKRQRQAQTVRKSITYLVVLFILLLNFISDFSSFATFAGFLTAGLAVALQSVLLALVGHFFFYGRYGVRRGDRITVGGVTGDILQIGFIRFYIRELQQMGDELKPTGKVVAFPNSILFQPSAFYKYMDIPL